VHELTGGPQVVWHSLAGNTPASLNGDPGSARGRDSSASHAHVQGSSGMVFAERPQPHEPHTSAATKSTMPSGTGFDIVLEPCGMLGGMGSGGWNLILGLVAFAAGASGQFALPGTSSPMPLMIAGGAIALLGAFQLWRRKS